MSKKGHKVETCQCMACRMERKEFSGDKNPMRNPKIVAKSSESHKGHAPASSFEKGHIPWNKGSKGVMKENSGSFQKGHIPWLKGLTKETDERIAAYSEENSKMLKDKTYEELFGKKEAKRLKKLRSEAWKNNKNPMKQSEVVAKMSKIRKDRTYEEIFGVEKGKQLREQRSVNQEQLWQGSEYIQMQMKARNVQPNKAELRLSDLLKQFLPNEYKYVGDGEFILAGKCPDFINTNGQKKIIELFGDYWHKGDDGKERVALFAQYGYQTLIVWENELEDERKLGNKILQFNNI